MNSELSDTIVDMDIPSFPGSPRSITREVSSSKSREDSDVDLERKRTVDLMHSEDQWFAAAATGNDKLITFLMSQGENVNKLDLLGRNALHFAVCADSVTAIKLLLEAGVSCNIKDDIGMTPLCLSMFRKPSLEVTQMLFNHGAKMFPRASPMDTGLFIQFVMMCTPTWEEAHILRLLVSKGAQVNDASAPGGRQPLHFAAMSNNCELIKLLLELGANPYLLNHRKQTPKHVALSFQCKEAADLLESEEENYEISEPSQLSRNNSSLPYDKDKDTSHSSSSNTYY